MVKKVVLIIILLSFAKITYGDTILGGYDQFNQVAGGHFHNTVWKAFRFQAVQSGEATYIKLYLTSLIGERSDDEVGVAVYDDNSGEVGNLKAWGYVPHYDWNVIGTGEFHSFNLDHVEINKNINSGNYYWISIQTSGGDNVYMQRGNSNSTGCPASTLKRGVQYTVITPPPSGSSFDIVYGNGCYGWSIYNGINVLDTMPPAAPSNLNAL